MNKEEFESKWEAHRHDSLHIVAFRNGMIFATEYRFSVTRHATLGGFREVESVMLSRTFNGVAMNTGKIELDSIRDVV